MDWQVLFPSIISSGIVVGVLQAVFQHFNNKKLNAISERKATAEVQTDILKYVELIIEQSNARVAQAREDTKEMREERDAERLSKREYRQKFLDERQRRIELEYNVKCPKIEGDV